MLKYKTASLKSHEKMISRVTTSSGIMLLQKGEIEREWDRCINRDINAWR